MRQRPTTSALRAAAAQHHRRIPRSTCRTARRCRRRRSESARARAARTGPDDPPTAPARTGASRTGATTRGRRAQVLRPTLSVVRRIQTASRGLRPVSRELRDDCRRRGIVVPPQDHVVLLGHGANAHRNRLPTTVAAPELPARAQAERAGVRLRRAARRRVTLSRRWPTRSTPRTSGRCYWRSTMLDSTSATLSRSLARSLLSSSLASAAAVRALVSSGLSNSSAAANSIALSVRSMKSS